MKIGMITDSLPGTDFDALLATAARLDLDMLEFGCGNWSSAPHLNLDRLLESDAERRNFKARLAGHGIAISALNCSGNPLHPGESGRRHDAVTRKTIRLASLMDVDRVVMMSGCPGAEGDGSANWITTEWPPEVREILRWQWDEMLIPYWRDLVAYANGLGIRKLCLELHGHQNVYNVRTLTRLRGVIETTPGARFQDRAWNYITLGYGHGELWWREFVAVLAAVGYDDVFSIEHEDPMLPALEGVEKSVEFLRHVLINRRPVSH